MRSVERVEHGGYGGRFMDITIISGLSGAGKSRVAAVLEDMDFYCVDNMPVSMMGFLTTLSPVRHT